MQDLKSSVNCADLFLHYESVELVEGHFSYLSNKNSKGYYQ